jgi:ribosomal protein S18 acetylase RimI-like enzyme
LFLLFGAAYDYALDRAARRESELSNHLSSQSTRLLFSLRGRTFSDVSIVRTFPARGEWCFVDALFNPDEFLLQLPVWALVHPVAKAGGPITIEVAGKKATPLFSDEDLARRFQETTKSHTSQYVLGCIDTPTEFLGFLDWAEREGFTHVTIDGTTATARFYPINHLRRSLEAPEDGADPSPGSAPPITGD